LQTATSDKKCTDLIKCELSVTYRGGKTSDGNQKCTAVTKCNLPATNTEGKQYIRTDATISSDNMCEREIVCDAATQSFVAATASTEATCKSKAYIARARNRKLAEQKWYACKDNSKGQYTVSGSITDANDSPVCGKVIECEVGKEYEVSPPSANANRVCQAYTACATVVGEGTTQQFQSKAPTNTSNRECANVVPCTTQQYQTAAATATENTKCDAIKICKAASQYISQQHTLVTNRECKDLTVCTLETEYMSLIATANSDRVCSARTPCDNAAGVYNSATLTLDTDSTCSKLTVCRQDQYQEKAATSTSNRECKGVKECTASDQFISKSPTTTSDRECTQLTVCDSAGGEYISVQATASSNRECATEAPTKAPTATLPTNPQPAGTGAGATDDYSGASGKFGSHAMSILTACSVLLMAWFASQE
jgi:hypothetical protein